MFDFFRKKPASPLPPLKLHNTLSGALEAFKPLNHTARMYNCGPTPYDRQHIGNLFGPVVFNVLRRALEVWGYPVKQVINITDFGHLSSDADEGDDKMSLGLRREGLAFTMKNMRALAEKYAVIYIHDLTQLGVDVKKITFPRASDYIKEEIALIKALEEKGYAYQTGSGVYFDVSKFPAYGKLGGINLAGQQTGARVEENVEKRGSYDFALWKFDKKLGWKSPWGLGFPGWHIECTAMIFALLGKQIDIHTGGIEHIPVHHNNEIAQAEALTGKQYVRYWLHNEHITIEGKKISKSLGNTVYLHNLLDKGLSPRSLRYWFLTGHYRTPMNFTWDAIEGADTALTRLTRAFLEMPKGGTPDGAFMKDFYTAIADDLDTPRALARVWELMRNDALSPAAKRASLLKAEKILGLGFSEPRAVNKLRIMAQAELPAEVQQLVTEREEARKSKDFARSDELRERIAALGFEVTDTSEGSKISSKR